MPVQLHPYFLRSLDYTPVEPEPNDPIAAASCFNDCSVHVDRAGKRRRIEHVATRYLRGHAPFIISASLRGPLGRGWTNPWATANTARAGLSEPEHRRDRKDSGGLGSVRDIPQQRRGARVDSSCSKNGEPERNSRSKGSGQWADKARSELRRQPSEESSRSSTITRVAAHHEKASWLKRPSEPLSRFSEECSSHTPSTPSRNYSRPTNLHKRRRVTTGSSLDGRTRVAKEVGRSTVVINEPPKPDKDGATTSNDFPQDSSEHASPRIVKTPTVDSERREANLEPSLPESKEGGRASKPTSVSRALETRIPPPPTAAPSSPAGFCYRRTRDGKTQRRPVPKLRSPSGRSSVVKPPANDISQAKDEYENTIDQGVLQVVGDGNGDTHEPNGGSTSDGCHPTSGGSVSAQEKPFGQGQGEDPISHSYPVADLSTQAAMDLACREFRRGSSSLLEPDSSPMRVYRDEGLSKSDSDVDAPITPFYKFNEQFRRSSRLSISAPGVEVSTQELFRAASPFPESTAKKKPKHSSLRFAVAPDGDGGVVTNRDGESPPDPDHSPRKQQPVLLCSPKEVVTGSRTPLKEKNSVKDLQKSNGKLASTGSPLLKAQRKLSVVEADDPIGRLGFLDEFLEQLAPIPLD